MFAPNTLQNAGPKEAIYFSGGRTTFIKFPQSIIESNIDQSYEKDIFH